MLMSQVHFRIIWNSFTHNSKVFLFVELFLCVVEKVENKNFVKNSSIKCAAYSLDGKLWIVLFYLLMRLHKALTHYDKNLSSWTKMKATKLRKLAKVYEKHSARKKCQKYAQIDSEKASSFCRTIKTSDIPYVHHYTCMSFRGADC